MSTIKNTSAGLRAVWIADPVNPGQSKQVMLAPGQSITATIADPISPVYKAWQDRGDMDFGGGLTAPPTLTTTAVTNHAASSRGINIIDPATGQGMLPVMLQPGETRNVQLWDPANPVYRGMQAKGEVDFGGALTS